MSRRIHAATAESTSSSGRGRASGSCHPREAASSSLSPCLDPLSPPLSPWILLLPRSRRDLQDGEVTGELHHGEQRWRVRSSPSPHLGHGRRGSLPSLASASCGGHHCPCRCTRPGPPLPHQAGAVAAVHLGCCAAAAPSLLPA
jgi:hypothetical protein